MSIDLRINLKNMKIKPISLILVVIVACIATGVGYIYWGIQKQKNYISDHCPGYESIPPGFVDTVYFIDCSNSLAIEQWDDDDYFEIYNFSLASETYQDQLVARVNNYVIKNNHLYFIEDPSVNGINYGERCNEKNCTSKTKYMIYYLNGEKQTQNFVDDNEIPLFRKISTVTGDFSLYKNIEDVPENERSIFEGLSR